MTRFGVRPKLFTKQKINNEIPKNLSEKASLIKWDISLLKRISKGTSINPKCTKTLTSLKFSVIQSDRYLFRADESRNYGAGSGN